MRFRFRHFSIYFIPLIILSILFLIVTLFILNKYPVQVVTKDFEHSINTSFTLAWPISALEIELQERKRLRRYAKSEQERRIKLQNEKMKYIQVVISDFFDMIMAYFIRTEFEKTGMRCHHHSVCK
ncbi:MAG: hypothetical protein K2X39_08465 [Silvanigrellaceae bacterium]|nr:hypothetical protein [Silvanigrellaceae bacterium]